MASLSTSELKKSIAAILKGADLNTLSSKKVRKKLEEQYDSDFCDRKEEIDEIVMAMVTSGANDKKSDSEDVESERENSDQGSSPHNSESEEEKEQSSKPLAKRKHEKETNDMKSESNSESEDEIEDKRPPPKKSKPAAKKQPKKEAKNDERESGSDCEKSDDDVDDEALARKLQEEERNSRSRAVKKNFNKKESVKKSSKSKGEGKPRKGSVYSRKCALSADLADVVGASEMARHDIVKKMWEVVRERNLFDPKNKRFAICDEQLQKVFGAKRVRMFGMMKYLKNHVKDQH